MASTELFIIGLHGNAGAGKALALDTPIATRTGWTTMRDIAIGDQVFDENGELCNVTHVFDVQENRPCYEVEFSDGAKVVCDVNHEWFTASIKERAALATRTPEARMAKRLWRGGNSEVNTAYATRTLDDPPGGSIKTTGEIAKTIKHMSRTNHSIDVANPLQLGEKNLPIAPYLLGVWLGDGSKDGAVIHTSDDEVLANILDLGYEVKKYKAKYAWGIGSGLHSDLRVNGLLGNKHIPQEYLRSSFGQRLELLRGLVDSDGYLNQESGSIEVTFTNRALMDGLMELLSTLGIKARMSESRAMLRGKDCGPRWRTTFTTDLVVSRLPRRTFNGERGVRKTQKRRYIVGATRVESVPVRCIEVDSPSHLYLCGAQMIPTHNSTTARQIGKYSDGETLVVNTSFAEPLYRSAAAALGITVDELRALKEAGVDGLITVDHAGEYYSEITGRSYLERYGTGAHRDVFGESFWIDVWQRNALAQFGKYDGEVERVIITVDDVRFPNEHGRVKELGGYVVGVSGSHDYGLDKSAHPSRQELPVDYRIFIEHGDEAQNRVVVKTMLTDLVGDCLV